SGDRIWVSGTIGDAFLGLAALRGSYSELPPEQRAALIARFQLPEPRVGPGPRLAGIGPPMCAVSDGPHAALRPIRGAPGGAALGWAGFYFRSPPREPGYVVGIYSRHCLRRAGAGLWLDHQPGRAGGGCRERPDAGNLRRGAARRQRLSQPAIPHDRDRRDRDPDHPRLPVGPARRARLSDRRG